MKKILVLLLVLCVASMANATTLSWSQSSIDITIGTTAVVQLIADDAQGFNEKWVGNNASSTANITGVAALAAAGLDAVVVESPLSYVGWWTVVSQDMVAPFDSVAAGNQYNVTITASALGTITFDSDYGTGGNDVLTVNVVPVPEPMTIALLGLGGLFLRRRK